MTNPLQIALAEFYKSHVYRGMPVSAAVQPVKEAIADPVIKEQAINRLCELQALNAKSAGRLDMRCFVSNMEKTALEESLNG